jgi:hypothetical protein
LSAPNWFFFVSVIILFNFLARQSIENELGRYFIEGFQTKEIWVETGEPPGQELIESSIYPTKDIEQKATNIYRFVSLLMLGSPYITWRILSRR